jgi:plastocyanin
MSRRTLASMSPLVALLVASLTAAALSACSPRHADAATGAGPSPADTASLPDTTLTPTAGAASAPDPSAAATADSTVDSAAAAADRSDSADDVVADSHWVAWDPATKTVTFRLVAGPFDWNGYTNGGATLTVPSGSTNVFNFEQNDGTPHSAEVGSGTGAVPNSGGDPAIPRAYTNKVVEGLPQGAKDVIRFTAPDTGTFRIICGVPGHALSGMWIWLKVDPAAKTPSFGPTPK